MCVDSNLLYIVGNGFDLNHGMTTKCSNFRQWLVVDGRFDVIQELQKAFLTQKDGCYLLWSDFERALGEYDIDVVLNWNWEDLYLTEYSIGGQLFGAPNFLLDTRIPDILSGSFTKWVDHIPLPTHTKYVDLKPDAYYL